MPLYHLYGQPGRRRARDSAVLPDDAAAIRYALHRLRGSACIDVWEGTRHIAQLWGEAAVVFAQDAPAPAPKALPAA